MNLKTILIALILRLLGRKEEREINKLDKSGIDFLIAREGLKLNAYIDTVGILTIGIGIRDTEYNKLAPKLNLRDKKLKESTFITKDEAIKLKELYLEENIYPTLNNQDIKWKQNQYNAICSFLYNVGKGWFTKIDKVKYFNEKDKRCKLNLQKIYIDDTESTSMLREARRENWKAVANYMSYFRKPPEISTRRDKEITLLIKMTNS